MNTTHRAIGRAEAYMKGVAPADPRAGVVGYLAHHEVPEGVDHHRLGGFEDIFHNLVARLAQRNFAWRSRRERRKSLCPLIRRAVGQRGQNAHARKLRFVGDFRATGQFAHFRVFTPWINEAVRGMWPMGHSKVLKGRDRAHGR
jgi:hypothetical protein